MSRHLLWGRGFQTSSDKTDAQTRPLIGFVTGPNAPPISPAPISRAWMSEMTDKRTGWPTRCLPMLVANQSGWELRNPCGFTATWVGEQGGVDVLVAPDKRDRGQFLPAGHFGSGILTWHLPLLFRTPPGYNLLVRGPANHPKDGVSALEGVVETDWASASFSMSWKLTRKLMPVRFEVDEPICMIVPQRRAELEEFAPELRCIESDEVLQRRHELFLRARSEAGQTQTTVNVAAGERLAWQADYTKGRHRDGEAGAEDHQTRRHLRSFVQPQSPDPSRTNPSRTNPSRTNPSRTNPSRTVVAMPLSGEYAPSTSDWSREQAEKYIESGGTDGTELQGMPVILLTTVGAKSGKLRKTPLMRVEHDGQYAIVASLGGAPKNPVWYYNVAKNPRVELQDGTVTGDYDAREVFGDEKATWWERAVAAYPPYADYQKNTERQIPVFVLTPVS